MGFIRNLLKGKFSPAAQPSARGVVADQVAQSNTNSEQTADLINSITSELEGKSGGVNIWDFDGPKDSGKEAELVDVSAASDAAPKRARRNKTRLIGFDTSEGDVVNLFDEDKGDASDGDKLPVGFVVITSGPGRGTAFNLVSGANKIGSDKDQDVELGFGDDDVAGAKHAVITFEEKTASFKLNAGLKKNEVSLNGKAIEKKGPIKSGDTVRVGSTELRFVALCDKTFRWADEKEEENTNVASA